MICLSMPIPTAQLWLVYRLTHSVALLGVFAFANQIPFLVEMVGKGDLPNAIALNSSIVNGARVAGPAIAGFAIGWIGEGWCFFLNGISFVAVIVALLL